MKNTQNLVLIVMIILTYLFFIISCNVIHGYLLYICSVISHFHGINLLNFAAVNRGDVKDSDIDVIMDSIVDSLFSVFVNLGE